MSILHFIKSSIPRSWVRLYVRMRDGSACLVHKSIISERLCIPKGIYQGKRCFIIGGGPSINQMDLSPLHQEYCCAVNRGFLLREKGLAEVAFYGLSDRSAYIEYGHQIPADFSKNVCLFGSIPWQRADIQNVSSFSMYSDHAQDKFMSRGFFQYDLTQPVAHTYTVVLQMLQVAVYAGFTDIYFIGVDNDFGGSNMHFYPDTQQEKKNMKDWRFNPCSDNEKAFSFAYADLKKRGINLYNAGVGGQLMALPRVSFEELFL